MPIKSTKEQAIATLKKKKALYDESISKAKPFLAEAKRYARHKRQLKAHYLRQGTITPEDVK